MDLLVTEELDSPAMARLAQQFSVRREPTLWKDPAKLRAHLAEARCVMVRNQTRLSRELIEAAPNLLAIGRFGVGLDNIDLDAANTQGVVVIAPLNANAVSVAELTMGLLLALARKIPRADRSTKSGGWDRSGCTSMEIEWKTLALCGFGRIGRLVAMRARAFGLRVLVFDPFVKPDAPELREANATLFSNLFEMLAQADFVSAHLPLNANTRHLFDARAFATMKRGSFFVNTSRGGVVDEGALLAALRSGQVAGAALDVREVEPPVGGDAFGELENVILTPHIGAFTVEAQARTFEAVCSDLERILHGKPAINFVNFPQPRRSTAKVTPSKAGS